MEIQGPSMTEVLRSEHRLREELKMRLLNIRSEDAAIVAQLNRVMIGTGGMGHGEALDFVIKALTVRYKKAE